MIGIYCGEIDEAAEQRMRLEPVLDAGPEESVWRQRVRVMALVLRTAPKIPLGILIIISLAAVFAPLISPHDPLKQDLSNTLQPPPFSEGGSLSHPLGTDRLGRDMLSRVITGARVSLSLSGIVLLMGGTLGVLLGLASGYMGGLADAVIQRAVEAVLAMPRILVAVVFVFVFGASFRSVVLVLAPFLAASFARMVRGETLAVKEQDYVALAEVLGVSSMRMMLIHILPNVANTIIVLTTFEVGRLILLESTLSFLGVGVSPPTPAWGLMVASGRNYLVTAYWLSLFPGLAILFTVLSLNLLGDWLRDTLDPKRREL